MSSYQSLEALDEIYLQIIDETIKKAQGVQPPAILEKLKQKWIENLKEHIIEGKANYEAIAGAASNKRVARNSGLKVRAVETSSGEATGVKLSAFDEKKMSSKRRTPEYQPSQVLNLKSGGQEEDDDHKEEKDDDDMDDEDEDDWGEWETEFELARDKSSTDTKDLLPSEIKKEDLKEEVSTKEDEEEPIPKDSDFEANLITRYGANAMTWENPDMVDSDIDKVSDISDVEPEAEDLIVAQFESVTKPQGKRSTHSRGNWKIRLKNGIAKIGGQEFFFSTLTGDLLF